MILEIILDGKPYPQPRVKVGKFGSYYSSKHKAKLKETEAQIQKQVKNTEWQVTTEPIEISITTISPRPKRLNKIVVQMGKRLYKPTIPDIDNYSKYILDCITKSNLVWADDKQVVVLHQRDFYANAEETPCTQVKIRTIDKEG
tara:strand:- start:742 stop:1173 length:432 start_codon:yes stop_codon:yes gene_type:complete